MIDDDASFRRLIARIAEAAGFETVATDNPEHFIERTRVWHPSLIILDLKMPGVDGIQLLRDLAADQCSAQLVLASGMDGKVLEAAQQLGRERGLRMSGLLSKPVRAQAVRELLAAFKPVPKAMLTSDLADAIVSGQLFLEYQPKLDCRLNRIIGVEALVRWRHPHRGTIPPGQFVALAEESGVIHRLTDWVVATAARQAVAWRSAPLGLEVAVNISALDVLDRDLPDRLEQLCREAGVAPSTLILELTETSAMREAVQMMDVLTRLRLKGFKLAIDDFGTGYSSLVQLQRMPFSEVKIDRGFVADMGHNESSRAIVEITIDLARKLGLKNVAEGVEDKSALALLTAMGCNMAQGYYVCRPLPADKVDAFVRGFAKAKLASVA
jgi:EAL domain-containing protein (putative c-di-GMP-specific phosphodiesterase class I)